MTLSPLPFSHLEIEFDLKCFDEDYAISKVSDDLIYASLSMMSKLPMSKYTEEPVKLLIF